MTSNDTAVLLAAIDAVGHQFDTRQLVLAILTLIFGVVTPLLLYLMKHRKTARWFPGLRRAKHKELRLAIDNLVVQLKAFEGQLSPDGSSDDKKKKTAASTISVL